ncbi:MAG: ATP-grasp domain-containing protein [Alphaproteobacteria bacterium]|nr:ATP-grasp domain-containing protein [Alphaproteobacteria bacterium]
MFEKVLIANRGAVAARVLRSLRTLGIRSVAVYSEADAGAPYLEEADESHAIGAAHPRESYLNQDVLIEVLKRSGADGVHPGYGFLAENPDFAERVAAAGATFIGPSPRWISAMGHKTRARDLVAQHGLTIGGGSRVLALDDDPAAEARKLGFPVLIKPAAGGGGIGMLPARDEAELVKAIKRARSMAERGFGNGEVYLERLIDRPRHVEFQILGDRHGDACHIFERDCSVQRRHQKIIEEAPAPGLSRDFAEGLADRIAGTMKSLGYDNIGTVEMLMAPDGGVSFLEVNTRLQVEHGVTEEVTGIDLVASQIRSAAGERLAAILPKRPVLSGHAIQARVYAEDPKTFFPSPGRLETFRPPYGRSVRIDTGYREGQDVTPFYDPMLAKVIVHEASRGKAIERLIEALAEFDVRGVKTNIPALVALLGSEPFRAGDVHTGLTKSVISG